MINSNVHSGSRDRSRSSDSQKFTNVYVKNLPDTVSDEEFRNMFEKFGLITSAVVMKDADGKSRCFGFVNFQNFDNAAERISRFEKLKGENLYLKNLDETINEETLKDLFSKFGTITSCKVNLDPQGISKGSGFVAFSNPDDAAVAMNEMNGTMAGKKPLYVVVAHRKDERRAHLQVSLHRSLSCSNRDRLELGVFGVYSSSSSCGFVFVHWKIFVSTTSAGRKSTRSDIAVKKLESSGLRRARARAVRVRT
ncbi:hypothetical protein POM88_047976 [Heracleum sosnowskyi]|uniref:RRM domain-containing protein n=1 Tax=Heracleum sosnowskyi TaxID=360622 RepID=A0AAD8LY13_9APIA|nr:hypothetical protein POM88_047976 [Heracleum sosnowskyi]